MTDYNAIPDASINPDSAITTQLKTRERDNLLATAEQSSGAPTLPSTRIYYCEEQLASGNGSNIGAGATTWNVRRDLVEVVDTLGADGTGAGSITGANDDTINLPLGTYWMDGTSIMVSTDAQAFEIASLRLRNTTNAATLLQGPSYVMDVPDNHWSELRLYGYFQITGTKALQFQHYTKTNIWNGGEAATLGVEVYARVAFWRLNLTGT